MILSRLPLTCYAVGKALPFPSAARTVPSTHRAIIVKIRCFCEERQIKHLVQQAYGFTMLIIHKFRYQVPNPITAGHKNNYLYNNKSLFLLYILQTAMDLC